MDRVYLVTVCEDDSSFDVLVRHTASDHEGVAKLVGETLLSDETIASPDSVLGLDVFEFGDGPGVLESLQHTQWKLSLDTDAGDDWSESKWLKVEHEDEA